MYALLILVVIAIISITTIIFILLFPTPIPEPVPVPIIPEVIPEPTLVAVPDLVSNFILLKEVTVCAPLLLEVEFKNQEGDIVEHVNYDIEAVQNENVIISEQAIHRHPNQHPSHEAPILLGVFPIDITLTLQGIGHGDYLVEPIDVQHTYTVTPDTSIDINCSELHEEEEDELPQ